MALTPDGQLHLGDDALAPDDFRKRVVELGRANPMLNSKCSCAPTAACPMAAWAELIGWCRRLG